MHLVSTIGFSLEFLTLLGRRFFVDALEIYLEKGCWVPIPHLYTLLLVMGFRRLLTHMWIWRNSKAWVLLGA